MALDEATPQLTRPEGHKDSPEIRIPNQDGLVPLGRMPDAGCRMTLTRTLMIGTAKTGKPLFIDLHPTVVEAIKLMPDWRNVALARDHCFPPTANASASTVELSQFAITHQIRFNAWPRRDEVSFTSADPALRNSQLVLRNKCKLQTLSSSNGR